MTYKQKLIDLLKSDAEVKKAMYKLGFGTRIILKDYFGEQTINQLIDRFCLEFKVCVIGKTFSQSDIEEIIGIPLQERFIRMYCKSFKPKLNQCIDVDGKFWIGASVITILDNTKDFDNQTEETYKQIFLALTNLTNKLYDF